MRVSCYDKGILVRGTYRTYTYARTIIEHRWVSKQGSERLQLAVYLELDHVTVTVRKNIEATYRTYVGKTHYRNQTK